MVNPTGYTALDLIGYTDKGAYNSASTYVRNDLVHYNSSIWRCLVDDTTAVTPVEGAAWTIFIEQPDVMTGATQLAAGSSGLTPAPAAGDQDKFLKGDGTWDNPPYPTDMTGATSSAAGEHGLVPAPLIADKDAFLKGDGTWDDPPLPPDMTGATSSANGTHGLVPAPLIADKDAFLKGDGTWGNPTAAPMTGATASTDGSGGSVPAPLTGEQNKVLFGDGDWGNLNRLNRTLYFTSVACSATTGNFATVSDARITADHVMTDCVFNSGSAITAEGAWTTAAGSLTLNGTCISATTADIILQKKDN